MRRWTLGTAVLSLFALGAGPLAAQTVSIGPMAGASFMTFHGSDAELFVPETGTFDKGTRTGFAAGGFAEFEFGGMWAIEPQLLYVQKGAKYSGTFDDGSGTPVEGNATLKLDYIQVPVLFKAELKNASGSVTPALFAGPAIGFKTSCKVGASAQDTSVDIDCGDGVKSTEFSAVFGAGLEFNRLSLQGRYDLGLSHVGDGSNVKNGGFLVTLGYGFRLR